MTTFKSPIFNDFITFAGLQIASTDIDPVYPVLRHSFDAQKLEPEIQAWRLLLYVTWYHLGTAEQAWTRWPFPDILLPTSETSDWLVQAKTGVERRGFRGNIGALCFINDTLSEARGPKQDRTLIGWIYRISAAYGGGLQPERAWDGIRSEFQRARGAGPWASYKWADLVTHVLGFPITASDIGVGGNGKEAGPVTGLMRLTNWTRDWCLRPQTQREFFTQCNLAFQTRGLPSFQGLEQMETALCDFNSLCKGTYYVGHDIDAMMEQLLPTSALWISRSVVIPESYRGEDRGWSGVRRKLKTRYRDTGAL